MKKRILFIIVLAFIFSVPAYALEIPELEGYDTFGKWAEEFSTGRVSVTPMGVINNIITSVSLEVKSFSAVAIGILIMTMLSSPIGTLNNAIGERASQRAAFFAFFVAIASMVLGCFIEALGYLQDVVYTMTDFMGKFTPVLIVMLFACSKSVSAAAFEPVLSAAVVVISEIIRHCLVPLIAFSGILSVAGHIGDKRKISGFVKLIKSTSKWIMALIITVFTGINTVYGFTSPALDAVAIKTAKFAMGSLVPVVGSFLSDTLETVTASAAIMKNAVGVTGIILICIICITPIIKIGVMQIMLKLISAISEPIADKRISDMLWDIGEVITTIFGVVVLTAVLFIINICIILRLTS